MLNTLDRVADILDGQLSRPGDPDWDSARQAWHLAVDQLPIAVALPGSVRDIVTIVDTARALGLRVAPQATGHNAAPLGPLTDTILLKTSRLRGVHVDTGTQVARVEAGALWGGVTGPAGDAGLAALAGSAPGVGVTGYTLGGGLSWLARKYGLATNSVLAIELVTADGLHRRVDTGHEPELFWALRGGGGSFGVVTALEFRLYPIREVYAGVLFWPNYRSRRSVARLARVVAHGAGRSHLGGAAAPIPSAARASRSPARALVCRRRGRLPGLRRTGRGPAACPAARAALPGSTPSARPWCPS